MSKNRKNAKYDIIENPVGKFLKEQIFASCAHGEKGKAYKEMSKETGLSLERVRDIATDSRTANVYELMLISLYLKIPTDKILFGTYKELPDEFVNDSKELLSLKALNILSKYANPRAPLFSNGPYMHHFNKTISDIIEDETLINDMFIKINNELTNTDSITKYLESNVTIDRNTMKKNLLDFDSFKNNMNNKLLGTIEDVLESHKEDLKEFFIRWLYNKYLNKHNTIY